MSTDSGMPDIPNSSPQPVGPLLSLRSIGELLVRHYGLEEGLFEVLLEYRMGSGPVGPSKDDLVPGIMAAVSRVGLVPATKEGLLTIDAAQVPRSGSASATARSRKARKAK